ncbi:MAG: glycosyltransferase [Verrucomicrobia bacterium]|nr:glycosyltransferase [Verrucomicrobiota bacterium]
MRTEPLKAALIISTYNWPEALGRVLESALQQTAPPWEIVVADDGSRPETGAVVRTVLGPSPARWCHVRQEDTGFRQSRVRNLGVRHASADLLIFLDHDTLLHPEFVADHVTLSGEGWFVQGKRCFLPPELTRKLLVQGLAPGWWPQPWMTGLGNRKNSVRCAWLGAALGRPKSWETAIRGCNLAVRRADFLRVDGFDELYDGVWGREDSDLAYRLFHSGVRCRNAGFAALQAHLHHPQKKRQGRDALDEELERMQREHRREAVRGYSRMDAEGTVIASSASPGEGDGTRR